MKRRVYNVLERNRELVVAWQGAQNFKPATMLQYRRILCDVAELLGGLLLHEADHLYLEAYANGATRGELESGMVGGMSVFAIATPRGEASRARVWSALKSYAAWAVHAGLVERSAVEKVLEYPVRRSRYDIKGHIPVSAVSVVIESAHSLRARVVCSMVFGTGVRRGELCQLLWRDVDLDGMWLIVRAEVAKGGIPRSVPIPDWVLPNLGLSNVDVVREYRESLQDSSPDAPVFPSRQNRGNPVGGKAIYSDFRSACLRSEVVPKDLCHPHAGRHTYAVWLLRKSGNIRNVQVNLGHYSLMTTEKYLGTADSVRARETREALSSFE